MTKTFACGRLPAVTGTLVEVGAAMAGQSAGERPSTGRGVSGEFHTQGGLFLAARAARRRGFAADRMWYLGDPSEDVTGTPLGFVRPVSQVRELAVAGAVLGLLGGLLVGLTSPTAAGLSLADLPLAAVVGALVGGLAFGFGAWAALSSLIGKYLLYATRGAALWLKIGVDESLPVEEQERRAELAERVLREAKAESLRKLDGTVEVNSPQSESYVA